MTTDYINAIGTLKIETFDSTGKLKDTQLLENLIVSNGKNYIASRMIGVAMPVMTHMGLGTGTVAPATSDTALGAQLSSLVALDSTTVLNNTVTYTCTFGPGVCTGAYTEAAIFNAATAGTMLNRTTFNVINKSAADTSIITWNVTIS